MLAGINRLDYSTEDGDIQSPGAGLGPAAIDGVRHPGDPARLGGGQKKEVAGLR